jgi:hypothetical protein
MTKQVEFLTTCRAAAKRRRGTISKICPQVYTSCRKKIVSGKQKRLFLAIFHRRDAEAQRGFLKKVRYSALKSVKVR